jgi:hypothetical protein
MEKAPAFQFYPKDFLTDDKVLLMSNESVGVYIKLLCFDWLYDGLPADQSKWLPLVRQNAIPAEVAECFKPYPWRPNFVTNPRLHRERIRQESNRNSKRKAGELGAKSRWNDHKINDNHGTVIPVPMAKNGSSSSPSSSLPILNTQPTQRNHSQPPPPASLPLTGETKTKAPIAPVTHNSLLKHFHERLTAELKEKPSGFNAGAAARIFGDLLKAFPPQVIMKRIEMWFASDESYIKRRGWRVEDFRTYFNQLKDGPIRAGARQQRDAWDENPNSHIPSAEETARLTRRLT